MAIIGIYKITNNITKKIYIGQSKDIYRRFEEHQYSSIILKSTKLGKSLFKNGIKNHLFKIEEICNIDELNKKEGYYINKYNSKNEGLNHKMVFETKPDVWKDYISEEEKFKLYEYLD
jgi:group I intron endonuclease